MPADLDVAQHRQRVEEIETAAHALHDYWVAQRWWPVEPERPKCLARKRSATRAHVTQAGYLVACVASSISQFRRLRPRYCVAAPRHSPL
jgi:hypothetical protein